MVTITNVPNMRAFPIKNVKENFEIFLTQEIGISTANMKIATVQISTSRPNLLAIID